MNIKRIAAAGFAAAAVTVAGAATAGAAVNPGELGTQQSGTGLDITTGPGFMSEQEGVSHLSDGPGIGAASFSSVYRWFAVVPGSPFPANQTKFAEWAPRGHETGEYMAETKAATLSKPGTVALVMSRGLASQWAFNGDTGQWVNKLTGDVLASTTNGGPVETLRSTAVTPGTVWTWIGEPNG
jgi:hypothetical protein